MLKLTTVALLTIHSLLLFRQNEGKRAIKVLARHELGIILFFEDSFPGCLIDRDGLQVSKDGLHITRGCLMKCACVKGLTIPFLQTKLSSWIIKIIW